MKLLFSITTYNRSYFLERLIKQISENKEHQIRINILDDASDTEHAKKNKQTVRKYSKDNVEIFYSCGVINRGKKKYWKLIDKMFSLIGVDEPCDYYFILPDDFILNENFIAESIKQYEGIYDSNKICLSLFIEKERIHSTNWVDRPSELVQYNDIHYHLTHWMDMCIISKIDFYKALEFRMDKVSPKRWEEYDAIGSGVGAQITRRLNTRYNLYHVSNSLCYEEEHVSMMNPNRSQSYTIQNNRRDPSQKVYVGIASIPEREEMLKNTINSLIHQVDKIFVSLNGYSRVPDFLNNKKIDTFISGEVDLGDAAKFNRNDNMKGGYFFTCDDDIIYPGDYIYNMINFIENNNRKAIIGLHGIILNDKIRNYYKDRNVTGCLNNNPTTKFVHILGTGAMAFHTSLTNGIIPVRDKLMYYRNMADIHFGIMMQEENIPMLCIKHDGDWLTYQSPKETIFDTHKNDCSDQTELVNSIKWKINTIEEKYIKELIINE